MKFVTELLLLVGGVSVAIHCPQNVLLSGNGVKLGDFVAAQILAPGATSIFKRIGTRRYMAPEVFRGDPVDHRADIWSLGCLLYEMVALTAPVSEHCSLW
jgi:serine/threonine protein kinase